MKTQERSPASRAILVTLLALGGLAGVTASVEAQACPVGRSCFYVPPALATPSGFTVDWDMVLSSPRGTITGTWRAGAGAATAFSVSPGTPLVIPLSTTEGAAGAYDTAERRGLFIEASSSELIVNHRLIEGPWQSSSTIKNATYALGSRFRLGSYNLNSAGSTDTGFDYASVHAPFGATVTFTAPPGATLPFWQGSPNASFSVVLTEGQTYVARTVPGSVCTRELMGGLVTSTDPVAVSSGGRGWSGLCSVEGGCGDDGADNILPVSGVGTQYVVHDFPTPSTEGEDIAVVADTDGTEVRVNGALVATLDAGEVHRRTVSALTYIETSAPAYVYQNSGRSGCEIDLAIIPPIVLAPIGLWVTDFNVSGAGRVGVVIATATLATLRLDGAVPTFVSSAVVPGRPDLTAVQFDVGGGNHSVRANADFQLGLVTSVSGTGLFGYFTPFRIPGCGDGSVSASEGCDDGGVEDGDGCSSSCRIEIGTMGCTDSADCVPSGRCDAGVCVARCSSDAACNDSDPCTVDSCNVSGACENAALSAGSIGECTGGTVCSGGATNVCVACVADAQCSGSTPRCLVASNTCVACLVAGDCTDDGNECTAATCEAQTCGSTNLAFGTVCSAGICDVNVACSTVAVDLVTPADESLTRNPRPMISGTATPGITVAVLIDATPVGMATADASGAWTFTPGSDLADGDHTVVVAVTGGVETAMDGADFTVDTVVTVAITEPVSGSRTTTTMPTITGTGEVGAMVTVTIDGMVLDIVTVAADGTWSVDVDTALAEGDHVVVAVAADPAGNSAMATTTFTVDLSTTVAITDPADGSRVMTATPTLSGTGEVGAVVVVSVDGAELGMVTVGADGTWSIDVTSALAEGTHTVRAEATDELGNMASAESDFEVDLGNAVAWLQPTVTGDSTPELSGTGEPGATIEVTVDETLVGSVTVDAEGNWSIVVTTPLADGAHDVAVTSTDDAGNVAMDDGTFELELLGPEVEIRSPVDQSTTSDTTPTISGTATPGSMVLVIVDGVILGNVRADATGAWSIDVTMALAAGPHEVVATVTDTDSYTSLDSHEFTVSADAPSVSIVAPTEGVVTGDPTPTISGTAEANAEVQVFVDGALVGTVTADDEGDWSIDVGDELTDGSHTVRAVARDEDGNTATDGGSFVVDTETEVAIVAPADGATVPGPRPTIVGTAEADATVVVSIDGAEVGTVRADAEGRWSLRVPSDLTAEEHDVSVVATDPAGNSASDASSFVVDTALDSDGDGFPDTVECPSEPCRDTDEDGTVDSLDPDDDGDGIPTALECPGATSCADTDSNETPNYLDPDDDGDGVPTLDEGSGTRDTDVDGISDHLDVDDDGDGFATNEECPTRPCRDTDDDGTPDYVDGDDDGDGIPTTRERADGFRHGEDIDGDEQDNWLDPNADGDSRDDREEGVGDTDGDGVPDYLDPEEVVMPDGGMPDGGVADGGVDAGSDAGGVDASVPEDASVTPDAGTTPTGGAAGGALCTATGGSDPSSAFGLALVGLALAWRRRRR